MRIRRGDLPAGFTLVELVLVLAIVSVLSVAFQQRTADADIFQARVKADALRAWFRQIHNVASERGCPISVKLTSDRIMASSPHSCVVGADVSVEFERVVVIGPAEVVFAPSGHVSTELSQHASLSYTVQPGNHRLRIDGETGFVD